MNRKVHYKHSTGPFRGMVVCSAWNRKIRLDTEVKAEVTCLNCIRYFANSATQKQLEMLAGGR